MIKKSLTPLLLWAALGLGAWSCRSALTADGIAAWTPGQSWLAALALLGLYVLKGLTAAFPSTALAAAAGLALPFPPALRAGPARGREVCLLRLAGVLPVELVSLWLGAAGTPRRAYFAGGLLGSFPRVLSATVLGAALWDLGGARFWASCVFGWALTGAALAVWGREWAVQPRSFLSRRISSPKKGRT